MAIRLSGMQSGLDTDAIVTELVKAKSQKKTTLELDQKKHSWKQDAWKALNTKIYNFYSKTLSNTRLVSDYTKKVTKSTSDAVSIVTSAGAPDVSQSLKVGSMAKAGYYTGAELKKGGNKADYTADTKLSDMGLDLSQGDKTISITSGGRTVDIDITADTKISDVVGKLKEAGVNASFDAKNQRFFVSSKKMGAANDFSLSGDADVLSAIGLGAGQGVKIDGSDAEITLNGETYTSASNTFDINGLTITVNRETSDNIQLTTTQDTDGIYDMVKKTLKEYNELIIEMDKLYNADSASKYKMLTDEEKEAMSEDEVKDWEEKIKSALLRRDSTLGNVFESIKQVMLQGVKMKDGTTRYLSDFGISTGGYFESKDNERNAFHIDGDPDDESSSTKEDKLKAAIATDPNSVAEFFAGLSKNLYSKIDGLMARTDYSSAFTVYNDKLMKTEYSDYTSKIAAQEKKVTTWEDFYYKKFTRMEKAMAQMQSKTNALSGLIGGGQ